MFFEYPNLLWLLLLLVPVVAIYIYREAKGRRPYLLVSSVAPWKHSGGGVKKAARHLPFILRVAALAAMIVAIARPRSSSNFERIDTEGIDIVLALDVSTSMLARDFNPDRIGAAKDIAIQFIAERPSDRIGVVVFAGESYTQSPLTTDRATLINLIKEIECGIIEDGTAIGNGLATAVARLKDSQAKSRVVILLTDGVNNSGEISPQMAAEIAKTYGIRVYTIGVGAEGTAPYPVMTPFGIDIQQVEVQIITMQPEIDLEEIERVKGELREYTERIMNGETSFSTMALMYSEDPGSARRGGELGFMGRGQFQPEFSAVAFNLTDPGKVSKIVETEYGFHVMYFVGDSETNYRDPGRVQSHPGGGFRQWRFRRCPLWQGKKQPGHYPLLKRGGKLSGAEAGGQPPEHVRPLPPSGQFLQPHQLGRFPCRRKRPLQ